VADERNGQTGTVLMAFVIGAIAGAAVALLWAPAPGAETRRKLGERARESSEKAAEAARRGSEFLRSQRENLSSAIERGKDAIEQVRGPRDTRGPKETA
jgi:gas vesicle protein